MADPDISQLMMQQRSGLIQGPSAMANLGGGIYRYGQKPNPNSKVYMGFTLGDKPRLSPEPLMQAPGRQNIYMGERTPTIMDYQEAALLPATWDQDQLREFVTKGILYKVPGFSPDMGLPEVMSKWDDFLTISWQVSSAGKQMSPWEVMETYSHKAGEFGTMRKGDWIYDVATGEKIKYVGPKSKTTTQKRVDLSSPEDARALTTQMLTELLGRAPTATELTQYKSAINDYETANPEMATTTVTLNDMGEEVSSSTTTSGGASQAALQQIIQDKAKEGPEYAEFQSATTVHNWLLAALGMG